MKVSITIEAEIDEESITIIEMKEMLESEDLLQATKLALEPWMDEIAHTYHISVQEL